MLPGKAPDEFGNENFSPAVLIDWIFQAESNFHQKRGIFYQ